MSDGREVVVVVVRGRGEDSRGGKDRSSGGTTVIAVARARARAVGTESTKACGPVVGTCGDVEDEVALNRADKHGERARYSEDELKWLSSA